MSSGDSTPGAGPSTRRETLPPPSSFSSSTGERTSSLSPLTRSSPLSTRTASYHGKSPVVAHANAYEVGGTSTPSAHVTPNPTSAFHHPSLSSNMRPTQSSSGGRPRDLDTPPPQPPPKDPIPTPTSTSTLSSSSDPLMMAARYKLSSRDQEAMRKLRSTMIELSDSGSSVHSSNTSPMSPAFPGPAAGGSMGHSSRGVRSRASTLSRQLRAGDIETEEIGLEEKEMPNSAPPQIPRPSTPTTAPPEEIIPNYTVVVIGHRDTGKSTVIARALKSHSPVEPVFSQLPTGHPVISYRGQYPPGGKIRMTSDCTFVELDIDALSFDNSTIGFWPERLPTPSGVVICYDATRRDTLRGVAEALHYLAPQGLPIVMMACKSDPGQPLEVNATYANSIGEPYNVGLIEVTNTTHEGKIKTRNGIRWLIYKLEQRFVRQLRKISGVEINNLSGSSSRNEQLSPESDTSSGADRIMWRQGFDMTMTETEGESDPKRRSGQSDLRSSSSSLQWMMKGPLSAAKAGTGAGSDKEPAVAGSAKVLKVESQENGEAESTETPAYFSLEDLLNQLFTAIVSTEDETFVKAFFMTYRRFCRPEDLMSQFLERFHEVESYAVAKDIQHWALQKLTGALIDWTSKYPGDLADPATQDVFRQVLALVLKYTFMAHLTGELILAENALGDADDLDASWALKPTESPLDPTPPLPPPPPRPPSSQPSASNTDLVLDNDVLYDLDSSSVGKSATGTRDSLTRDSVTKGSAASMRTVSSTSLALDNSDPSPGRRSEPELRSQLQRLGQSQSQSQSSVSDGQHRAAKPPSSSENNFTGRWTNITHYVLVTDPAGFAAELTKMQWELFREIRPRDVFRHDLGKEKDGPVGKAIQFFNHVSRWVSTIILSEPKAKHRARVYERLMLIAHQIRRLNNYDSLFAVISGMKETSVHRLGQTHGLVQAPLGIYREFEDHVKLMAPRGGYALYRKALAADLSHGRPAIPLLISVLGLVNRLHGMRQDIRAEDGFVHWDKFSRLAEILSIIPECQARGPIVGGRAASNAIRAYINDAPVIHDEDALLDRSRMLEASGGGNAGGNVLKRLGKLAF